MTRIICLLSFAFFATGCASKFFVPGNRFMSPESGGGTLKGDVKMGVAGVTDVQVADDSTSTAPDTTPKLIKNSAFALGTQLGIVDRVDAYLNMAFGAPGFFGAKVQALGDSAPDAKAGNFSLSLAGGVAFGDQKQGIKISSSGSELEGKSTISFKGWEAILLLGYRPSDTTLVYLSPFMTHLAAGVTVERTSNGTKTVTAEPDGSGDMRGLTLGGRLGRSFFLSGEISLTETQWKREKPTELSGNKFNDVAFGIAFGGAW